MTRRAFPDTLHDLPRTADTAAIPVLSRDIVIAATDGVFDNLFDQQIAELATQHCTATQPGQCAANLAKALVQASHRVGVNPRALSPFAAHARAAGYRNEIGGKLDDASAVVAVVV